MCASCSWPTKVCKEAGLATLKSLHSLFPWTSHFWGPWIILFEDCLLWMCAGLSKDCFCSPTCIIQFINTKTVVLLKLVEFFHLWLGPYSSSPSGLDIALSRTHTCSSGGSGWCPVGPCSSPCSQAKASWDPVHLWTCTSSSGGSSWCPVGPCTSFQGEGSWDPVHFCTCSCSIGGNDWCSAICFSRMRMVAYPEPAVCPVQAQPELSAPSALSYPEVPTLCGPHSSVAQHVLSQPEVCAPPLGPVLPKPKVLRRVCWQPQTKLPEESRRLWQFPVKCRLSRGRWPELLFVCFWTHLLLRFRLGPGSVTQLVDCLVLFSIHKWIHTFFNRFIGTDFTQCTVVCWWTHTTMTR